jgi:ubiquitin C-terminal hydrolase
MSTSSDSSSDSDIGIWGVNGIENQGNTCYLASIMQVLTHIPAIVKYFNNDYNKHLRVPMLQSLAHRMESIIHVQSTNKDIIIEPTKIIKWLDHNTELEVYQQQDCHEVLMIILDTLHEELKYPMAYKTELLDPKLKEGFQYWNNEFSEMYRLFQGMYQLPSEKYEPNSSIMLDIPSNLLDKEITLEDCLEYNKTSIAIYPEILVVMFKRYNDPSTKNHRKIVYPSVLTLPEKTYGLQGVIIHRGRTIHSGHYIAIARHDDVYYEFDDEDWSVVDNPVSKDAYMLFYSL